MKSRYSSIVYSLFITNILAGKITADDVFVKKDSADRGFNCRNPNLDGLERTIYDDPSELVEDLLGLRRHKKNIELIKRKVFDKDFKRDSVPKKALYTFSGELSNDKMYYFEDRLVDTSEREEKLRNGPGEAINYEERNRQHREAYLKVYPERVYGLPEEEEFLYEDESICEQVIFFIPRSIAAFFSNCYKLYFTVGTNLLFYIVGGLVRRGRN
ncbi:hypothetical protein P3W45_001317 [Vairimorpha bombi]|jgi:hypothetical protein